MRDTEEQFESRLLPLFVNRRRKVGGSTVAELRWGGATAPVSVPATWDGEGVWMCGMGDSSTCVLGCQALFALLEGLSGFMLRSFHEQRMSHRGHERRR